VAESSYIQSVQTLGMAEDWRRLMVNWYFEVAQYFALTRALYSRVLKSMAVGRMESH